MPVYVEGVRQVGQTLDGWRLLRGRKAFAATAGNGAVGTVAIADVTGQVETLAPLVYCSENLAEAGATATLDLGVTGFADLFDDGSPVNAVDLDVGDWWQTSVGQVFAGGAPEWHSPFSISANIILTVGAQNVTDGQLDFFIWWRPLSADGNLVLASGMTAI